MTVLVDYIVISQLDAQFGDINPNPEEVRDIKAVEL